VLFTLKKIIWGISASLIETGYEKDPLNITPSHLCVCSPHIPLVYKVKSGYTSITRFTSKLLAGNRLVTPYITQKSSTELIL
jgi:hypothetical protein